MCGDVQGAAVRRALFGRRVHHSRPVIVDVHLLPASVELVGRRRRRLGPVAAADIAAVGGGPCDETAAASTNSQFARTIRHLIGRSNDRPIRRLKPNSITLASSELAPNMFGACSELASVMEFGREPASSC